MHRLFFSLTVYASSVVIVNEAWRTRKETAVGSFLQHFPGLNAVKMYCDIEPESRINYARQRPHKSSRGN
jgi:hypothetical protein